MSETPNCIPWLELIACGSARLRPGHAYALSRSGRFRGMLDASEMLGSQSFDCTKFDMEWSGCITLQDGSAIDDIVICPDSAQDAVPLIPSDALLSFLAVVRISEVPLSLVAGPSYAVWTRTSKTVDWFGQHLLQEPQTGRDTEAWFDSSQESYSGILVRLSTGIESQQNVPTELLLYGVIDKSSVEQTGLILNVRALPLSTTQIEVLGAFDTPPETRETSPTLDEKKRIISGRFIDTEAASRPRTGSKRRTTSDIFDAASEFRRRIKSKGGAGISQAAAGVSQTQSAHLKNISVDLSKSDTRRRVQPDQKPFAESGGALHDRVPRKSLDRAFSLSTTTKSQDVFGLNSRKLVRTKSLPASPAAASVEQLNRDAISNLVLKGMRIYGFQSKKKIDKDTESFLLETASQPQSCGEDEYKSVYHQTFKAATFAFVSIVWHGIIR
jgi:Sld7 C-terminal domain